MDQEQSGKLLRMGSAAATVGLASCVHALAELLPLGQIMASRALISCLIILRYGLAFMRPFASKTSGGRFVRISSGEDCVLAAISMNGRFLRCIPTDPMMQIPHFPHCERTQRKLKFTGWAQGGCRSRKPLLDTFHPSQLILSAQSGRSKV